MTAGTPSSVIPGLLSDTIALYRTRPENFLASLLIHAMAVAFVLWLAVWLPDRPTDNGLKVGPP